VQTMRDMLSSRRLSVGWHGRQMVSGLIPTDKRTHLMRVNLNRARKGVGARAVATAQELRTGF